MITDFQLHAFIDRQLGSREEGEILREAARSPGLARRIADLQQLKQLVRRAYYPAETTTADAGKDGPSAPVTNS
jgi:hypothetical protein